MSDNSIINHRLFALLKGIWAGEGRGYFPTATSFDYHETLTFTPRGENTLAYEQRTQKRYDGGQNISYPIGRTVSSAFLKTIR